MAVPGSLAVGAILGGWPAVGAPNRSRAMRLPDSDSDGTVHLDEAKQAASALFDKLDHDRDGRADGAWPE